MDATAVLYPGQCGFQLMQNKISWTPLKSCLWRLPPGLVGALKGCFSVVLALRRVPPPRRHVACHDYARCAVRHDSVCCVLCAGGHDGGVQSAAEPTDHNPQLGLTLTLTLTNPSPNPSPNCSFKPRPSPLPDPRPPGPHPLQQKRCRTLTRARSDHCLRQVWGYPNYFLI